MCAWCVAGVVDDRPVSSQTWMTSKVRCETDYDSYNYGSGDGCYERGIWPVVSVPGPPSDVSVIDCAAPRAAAEPGGGCPGGEAGRGCCTGLDGVGGGAVVGQGARLRLPTGRLTPHRGQTHMRTVAVNNSGDRSVERVWSRRRHLHRRHLHWCRSIDVGASRDFCHCSHQSSERFLSAQSPQ